MTQVREIMSPAAFSCHETDSLNQVAQIMWEHDCGCVPVVDNLDRVQGVVTDRDVCMGAYTQGKALGEIPVSSVCSRAVQTCAPSDSLEKAEKIMIDHQVRRLPVTDSEGHLAGMLSLSDLAQHAHFVTPAKGNGTGIGALAAVMEAVSRARIGLERAGLRAETQKKPAQL